LGGWSAGRKISGEVDGQVLGGPWRNDEEPRGEKRNESVHAGWHPVPPGPNQWKDKVMRRLVSYMFTSLDGYIADPDGGLDWVPVDDELMRFANEYFGTAEGIVFGRSVYQGFVDYWDRLDPADPLVSEFDVEFAGIFRGMTRIVVSTTLEQVEGKAILVKDEVPQAIEDLKRQPGRDLLLVCGPELRSTLTRHGLVDRHRVLVAPVVLGRGQPLFSDMNEPLRLQLVATKVFGGGVVMLDYEPESTP
jgi:dihydrofolate reductase